MRCTRSSCPTPGRQTTSKRPLSHAAACLTPQLYSLCCDCTCRSFCGGGLWNQRRNVCIQFHSFSNAARSATSVHTPSTALDRWRPACRRSRRPLCSREKRDGARARDTQVVEMVHDSAKSVHKWRLKCGTAGSRCA